MDENDQAKAGKGVATPFSDAKPANASAIANDHLRPSRVYTVKELLTDSFKRSSDRTIIEKSCTTGHWELDDVTGGLVPAYVWVFGAGTGWGKSSATIMIADENIKRGKRVLIVSSEDPPSLYGDRLMVRRARVNANRFRKKRLRSDEIERVMDVANRAEDVPVYIQAGLRPIEKICQDIQTHIDNNGIDLIVFDYLQEFHSDKRHENERLRYKHTSSIMRDLIRRNDKCGIIMSQLTITDPEKIPTKNMIRESRDVSNAAEVVAIGFQPTADIFSPQSQEGDDPLMEAGKRYVIVDKNTNGPANKKVLMSWSEEYACFDTVVNEEIESYGSFQPDSDFDEF